MTHAFHETLDCSQNRKLFVAGDIHGEFEKFAEALVSIGFQPETDIVISVGDLVDRGPLSEQFEHYLKKPWFRRVLGNHDIQPREYLLGYESAMTVLRNGGQWLLDKSREEIEYIATLLEDAPLALTVITPSGKRVGITHADCFTVWHEMNSLDPNQPDFREKLNTLIGSRRIIRFIQNGGDPIGAQVIGIDHVFHGHTPLYNPLTVTNRSWIDTGACYGGEMTIIDVDDWLNSKEN